MTELLIILLIAGTMLIGAEVFIPGGVLGFIGGFALFGASVTAFLHPDITNTAAAGITGGIIIMVGVVIGLWIKFFPKTWIGKQILNKISQDQFRHIVLFLILGIGVASIISNL